VIVLLSPTVELKLNVAVPLSLVEAEAGAIVLLLPDATKVTETPLRELPLASRTLTVIVLVPEPAVMVVGEADTVEVDALGLPDVACPVKRAVAVPAPEKTAVTV
jgi:hypothetical protein